jgi:hypothetical protein
MKTEKEYISDLTEIRSMMERSTKFLSLTGWAGIMAGFYALLGAYIAYKIIYLNSGETILNSFSRQQISPELVNLIVVALAVLFLAVSTAIFLSYKKARKKNEKLWNSAARRLVVNMAIPLVTGGIFILIIFSKGFFGLIAPVTLIFYGLALLNASKFTYEELRSLGVTQLVLGLLATYYINYALLLWAFGFGLMHIVYGIYMHLKYEK